MKKAIFTLVTGISCLSLFAQQESKQQDLTDPKILLAVIRISDPSQNEVSDKTASLNDVSSKAIRDFDKVFKDVKDEKWYLLPNGYLAEFSREDAKTLVVYDKNGNWNFTICYAGERILPEKVRSAIKSVYYDYNIKRVEKIQVEDKVFYLANIDNDTQLKTVRVSDGEVEEIEEFNKN
jgi:hypothetical protein